jgi:hypothetical protein
MLQRSSVIIANLPLTIRRIAVVFSFAVVTDWAVQASFLCYDLVTDGQTIPPAWLYLDPAISWGAVFAILGVWLHITKPTWITGKAPQGNAVDDPFRALGRWAKRSPETLAVILTLAVVLAACPGSKRRIAAYWTSVQAREDCLKSIRIRREVNAYFPSNARPVSDCWNDGSPIQADWRH